MGPDARKPCLQPGLLSYAGASCRQGTLSPNLPTAISLEKAYSGELPRQRLPQILVLPYPSHK